MVNKLYHQNLNISVFYPRRKNVGPTLFKVINNKALNRLDTRFIQRFQKHRNMYTNFSNISGLSKVHSGLIQQELGKETEKHLIKKHVEQFLGSLSNMELLFFKEVCMFFVVWLIMYVLIITRS